MKPFQKGADCFNKGRLGNPYPPTTTDHRDWEYGFNKAYFINLKKVKELFDSKVSIIKGDLAVREESITGKPPTFAITP